MPEGDHDPGSAGSLVAAAPDLVAALAAAPRAIEKPTNAQHHASARSSPNSLDSDPTEPPRVLPISPPKASEVMAAVASSLAPIDPSSVVARR